jgi:pimeloyl-ACP methyl ester carboxylesterase
MPKVMINDLEMYYEVRGNGFPLILISGYSGNSESWNLPVPRASQLSKHYKVITLDNRGTGRSSVPEGDYSIKTMAEDVAGLLDSLKMLKAHVLGQSMGGMIAQELAINHPEKVKGLILTCTTPRGSATDTALGQRKALEKLTWTFAPPPNMPLEDILEELLKLIFYEKYYEENKTEIVSSSLALLSKYPTPLSTFEKHYDAITKFDAYSRLKTIRSKTLVIHGEDDNLIMPEAARILAEQIPNAELKMFKQAGHCVIEEKWEEVKPAILNFLERLD